MGGDIGLPVTIPASIEFARQFPDAQLLLVGLPDESGRQDAASSGNDASVSGAVRPGYLYGANDERRPAGAALGY